MSVLKCVATSFIWVVVLQIQANGETLPGNVREVLYNLDWDATVAMEDDKMAFSVNIHGFAKIDGLPATAIQATIINEPVLPDIETNNTSNDTFEPQHIEPISKDTAFYTGPSGSFLVEVDKQDGQMKSKLRMGIVHDDSQSCFLTPEKAYCSYTIPGNDAFFEVPVAAKRRRKRQNLDKMVRHRRRRRQIVAPTSSTAIINCVVFVDRIFVERFRTINGGSYSKAVADIKEYMTLFSNELTYRYRSLLRYNNGMDLAVHVVKTFVPEENSDWSFVVPSGDKLAYSSTMFYFRTNPTVRDHTRIGGPAVHAMLITGRELDTGYIGVAYVGTVCAASYADNYRVSISRDADFNAAHTAAHELAHGLGVDHDGYKDGKPCDDDSYVMSPSYYGATNQNKDTYYTFSSCTNEQLVDRKSEFDGCLSPYSVDFQTAFCKGPRGRLHYTSLDEQCQWYQSPDTGWTACNNIRYVTADQCWRTHTVSCCKGSAVRYLSLVWDGTPCEAANNYCFSGQCTDGNTICGTSLTTTTTTTTTTTATTTTPTTTTTTPTTTTTTPTTTTTTPTTTTTTPTTATTTPTTTTTTPTTTTTTPTTTTTTPTTTTTTPTTTTTTPTTTTTTITTTPSTTTTTTQSTTEAYCPCGPNPHPFCLWYFWVFYNLCN